MRSPPTTTGFRQLQNCLRNDWRGSCGAVYFVNVVMKRVIEWLLTPFCEELKPIESLSANFFQQPGLFLCGPWQSQFNELQKCVVQMAGRSGARRWLKDRGLLCDGAS